MEKNQSVQVNTLGLPEIAASLSAKPFRPTLLFQGKNAQTLAGYAYPRRFRLRRFLRFDETRFFEIEPGVKLLAHCRWQTDDLPKRQALPTVVLVHGLEGSSDSVYVLGTAVKAFRAGFNVVRLNLRTCGGTESLTQTLYHSGLSGDLQSVIKELIARDGLAKIFLAGFSLGGNMSLKMAGEWGAEAPQELRGVCAVSPSIDLAACAQLIEQPSNRLYNQRFVGSLKKRLQRVQKLYPDRYKVNGLESVRTIREFDSRVTAPCGGFLDVTDYYTRSSSLPLIKQIRIPALIIQAQDDPFIPFESFLDSSLAANPCVILLAPKHGGHVGFLAEAGNSNGEDRFWAENRLIQFCFLLANQL